MATKHTFKEHGLRVVAVVGLIAVLLLGAWGIIQLAFFIPTFLANLGSSITKTKEEAPRTTATTTVITQTPTAPIKPTASVTAPSKTPAKTTTTPKYVASGRTANLYGYPDLQVRMLNQPANVRAGSNVSMQFVVENIGTHVVPANWFFTAALPYAQNYTYQSPMQQALYPGDKIVYTLGYLAQLSNDIYGYAGSNYYQYNQYPNYGTTQSASVTVDPYNLVWELNEGNNLAGISYQVY
jgi:hypothetical protein